MSGSLPLLVPARILPAGKPEATALFESFEDAPPNQEINVFVGA